jgi:hypothetical protein
LIVVYNIVDYVPETDTSLSKDDIRCVIINRIELCKNASIRLRTETPICGDTENTLDREYGLRKLG